MAPACSKDDTHRNHWVLPQPFRMKSVRCFTKWAIASHYCTSENAKRGGFWNELYSNNSGNLNLYFQALVVLCRQRHVVNWICDEQPIFVQLFSNAHVWWLPLWLPRNTNVWVFVKWWHSIFGFCVSENGNWQEMQNSCECAVRNCFRALKTDGGHVLRHRSDYFCVKTWVISTKHTVHGNISRVNTFPSSGTVSPRSIETTKFLFLYNFRKFLNSFRLSLQWVNSLQTCILKDDLAASIECTGGPFCLVQCEVCNTSCIGKWNQGCCVPECSSCLRKMSLGSLGPFPWWQRSLDAADWYRISCNNTWSSRCASPFGRFWEVLGWFNLSCDDSGWGPLVTSTASVPSHWCRWGVIQRWTEVLNGVPLSMKPRCGKKSFIDGLPSNIGISVKIPIGNVCLLVGTHWDVHFNCRA